MPKKGRIPTRSKEKFPQNLTGGTIGRMFKPAEKSGSGISTRSKDKFPQNLTGGKIGRRFNTPG